MEANLKLKPTAPRSSDGHANGEEKEVELNFDLSWLSNLITIGAPPIAPKRKLLVLGLEGLLCEPVLKRGSTLRRLAGWLVKRANPTRTVYVNWPNDAGHENFVVYKRPHCQEFLKFCMERFDVAIWSTAEKWYADNALDCVMHGLKTSDLLFVWNREHCKNSGFKTLSKTGESIFLKDLNDVYQKRWGICSNVKYSSSNALMIESRPWNALLNPANSSVFPGEYKLENVNDNVLAAGGELWMFLKGLARAEDAAAYVKANRFGQPAITDVHPNWPYYRKIVHAYGGGK